MSGQKEPKMTSLIDYDSDYDYEEKSIKEMLEDSILIQLILMFVQIGLLFCKILCSLIRDIVDGVFLSLQRIFVEDGELMLMLDYVLPFLYYMKTE